MKMNEIWRVNFDPTIGAEIKKIRPAVIVSLDAIGILPLKVIVPITDWKDTFIDREWMVRLSPDQSNGLSKVSAADAFQVRSASVERFIEHVGELSQEDMLRIKRALAGVFDIDLDEN